MNIKKIVYLGLLFFVFTHIYSISLTSNVFRIDQTGTFNDVDVNYTDDSITVYGSNGQALKQDPTSGDLVVTLDGEIITVTATDLDIRNLSYDTDSIKVYQTNPDNLKATVIATDLDIRALSHNSDSVTSWVKSKMEFEGYSDITIDPSIQSQVVINFSKPVDYILIRNDSANVITFGIDTPADGTGIATYTWQLYGGETIELTEITCNSLYLYSTATSSVRIIGKRYNF